MLSPTVPLIVEILQPANNIIEILVPGATGATGVPGVPGATGSASPGGVFVQTVRPNITATPWIWFSIDPAVPGQILDIIVSDGLTP